MMEKRYLTPMEYVIQEKNELRRENQKLKEENEQLKSKNADLYIQLDFLRCENRHMKSVLETNKQLKQRLEAIAYYFRDGGGLKDLDRRDFEELKRLSSNETD